MSRASRGKRPATFAHEDESELSSQTAASDYDSESSRRGKPRPRMSANGNGIRSENGAHPSSSAAAVNSDSGGHDDDRFKPGSVVRVLVNDFCAYTKAEFFPGPFLNMVIGPNGTGKSTLVNAICLGLGYSPKLLNRADVVSEFVKHGKPTAFVEIELKKLPRDNENYVIRLRIRRENNSQKFWLNGREVPQKKIQTLVRNLNIQVDNLCQFLPQDRVAAFAGLGEVQLLDEMLRAAAPPKVINWHQRLKELYKDQAEIQKQVRTDTERLDSLHNSQRNMQADVDRVKDREAAQRKVELLRAALTATQYTEAAQKFRQAKEEKERSAARVRELEEENEPSLQAVTDRERYRDDVAAAVESRKVALRDAERAADVLLNGVRQAEEEVTRHEAAITAQVDNHKKKKAVVGEIRRKISQLEAQQKNEPPKFDSAEWNMKIREQEHIARDMQVQMNDLNAKVDNIKREMMDKKSQNDNLKRQLESLGTRQGKQLSALRMLDADAAKAYEWLQQNADKFEKEVFGPPILTCSVRDDKYSDHIQALLQKRDLVCFTAQTRADQAKLSHFFIKEMGLSVSLRTFNGSLDEFKPAVRARDLGFDGFAIDFLEGPSLLLAQFCATSQLHKAGISLNELSDEQFQRLDSQDYVTSWTAGRLHYKRTHRKEYGDAGKSTATKDIKTAVFWKDQPVDSSEAEELRRRQGELRLQFSELTDQRETLKGEIDRIFRELEEARTKLEQLKEEKGGLQAQYTRWKGIPLKIETEQKNLERAIAEMREAKAEANRLIEARIDAAAQYLQAALEHSAGITAVRVAHREWVDASIRLIEAKSDVAGLQERSRAIIELCEAERQKLETAQTLERESKAEARRLKELIPQLREQYGQEFTELAVGKSSNDVEDEISAEEERLGMISDVPQNTLQKYDQIVASIAKAEKQLEASRRKIEVLGSEIDDLRHKWEPRVDELVEKVTEAFGYNFQQIGCAGEVRLHKDEDFEKWALHVMVSYRPQEGLIRLTATRQSGGERTVATAFFLLALQGSAQAPFRVVDEINQGMDPRNERMVHNRMVEIACREHNSQYFLVTPKLLTGLRYEEGMTVLCVASGTHMPKETERLNLAECLSLQKRVMASAIA
ncbi:hypothetical protein jhhlp_004115 [Lomentospora prolificans]|uniref:Structural maintenance of chromosomes protein 5 n=1 Tax=Lomentospora prolificans TaxID=41688 RepID=A0A2N3NAN4_9PEZI|nr:hypothetical protein jhhlp_004115 [Lomentospora prolificans]